jgi:hypothetical protein
MISTLLTALEKEILVFDERGPSADRSNLREVAKLKPLG